eukprot:gb/GECG01014018.1/.p1 GENE.gb/GECG01014018.1/~~gb/GECG01014018.1/.p1  ORF type:complete len:1562 (+),score=342.66 gb/GECG01014018.1/:1-4686(+)
MPRKRNKSSSNTAANRSKESGSQAQQKQNTSARVDTSASAPSRKATKQAAPAPSRHDSSDDDSSLEDLTDEAPLVRDNKRNRTMSAEETRSYYASVGPSGMASQPSSEEGYGSAHRCPECELVHRLSSSSEYANEFRKFSSGKGAKFKQLRKKLKEGQRSKQGSAPWYKEGLMELQEELDGISPEELSRHYEHLQSLRSHSHSHKDDRDRTDIDEYIEVPKNGREDRFPPKSSTGDRETWSSWHFHDLVDDAGLDDQEDEEEFDEDDDLDDETSSEKEIISNLPSSASAGLFSSPGNSQYIYWNGKKHWLLLKEGVHIILDRLLGKTSPQVASKCPVYGRLSRIEKRAAVLKFAAHLVLRKPFPRDVIVDSISSGIYEACEQEALLESPEADEKLNNGGANSKKKLSRIPFMQKVMGEALKDLLNNSPDTEDEKIIKALTQCKASDVYIADAIDRMRDIWLNRSVVLFFDNLMEYDKPCGAIYNAHVEERLSIDYFLAPPPEFDEQDERLVMEAIRIDEEEAGKETVFAANLKKALKLARQSMKQRQREKDGSTAALTAGVKETLGLNRDAAAISDELRGQYGMECIGALLQQLYGSTKEAKEKSKEDNDGESTLSTGSESGDESWEENSVDSASGKPHPRDWWLDQPWLTRHCNVAPSAMLSALRDRPASWYQLWMRLSDSEKKNIAKLSAAETCDVIDSQPLWLSLRGMVGCNLYRDGVWPIISNDGHLSCVRFQKQNKEAFWYLDENNMNLASLFPLFISWSRTVSCNVRNELRSMGRHMANGRPTEVSAAIQSHLENAIATFVLFKVVAHSMATHAETIAGKVGKLLIEEEEQLKDTEEGGEKKSKKAKKKQKQKAKKKAAEEEKKRKQEEERKKKEEEERQRKEQEREKQAEIARQKKLEREKREKLEWEHQIEIQERELRQHNNLNKSNMASEIETSAVKSTGVEQPNVDIVTGSNAPADKSKQKTGNSSTKKDQKEQSSNRSGSAKPPLPQLHTVRGQGQSIPSSVSNKPNEEQQKADEKQEEASRKIANQKQTSAKNLPSNEKGSSKTPSSQLEKSSNKVQQDSAKQAPPKSSVQQQQHPSAKPGAPPEKNLPKNGSQHEKQTGKNAQSNDKNARKTSQPPQTKQPPVQRQQANTNAVEHRNSKQQAPVAKVDSKKSAQPPHQSKAKKDVDPKVPRTNGAQSNGWGRQQSTPSRPNKQYTIKTPPRYHRASTASSEESPENPLLHSFSAGDAAAQQPPPSQMPFQNSLFPLNSQAPQFDPLQGSTSGGDAGMGTGAPSVSGGWGAPPDMDKGLSTHDFGMGFGGTNWGFSGMDNSSMNLHGGGFSSAMDSSSFLPSYGGTNEDPLLAPSYSAAPSNPGVPPGMHDSSFGIGHGVSDSYQLPSSQPPATQSVFARSTSEPMSGAGGLLSSFGDNGDDLDLNYRLGLNLDGPSHFGSGAHSRTNGWTSMSMLGSGTEAQTQNPVQPPPVASAVPEPPGFGSNANAQKQPPHAQPPLQQQPPPSSQGHHVPLSPYTQSQNDDTVPSFLLSTLPSEVSSELDLNLGLGLSFDGVRDE